MTDEFESECVYHIFNKAIGEEKLFRLEDNYYFFLTRFQDYLGEKVQTLAYCLIPNHFHLLVSIRPTVSNNQVVKAFSDFQNSYSKSFNSVFDRNGSLFRRKFKRKKIEDEAYLSRIVIYLHQNPVKHRLVKDPIEWRFSSFRSYLSDKPTKLSRDLVLGWFGGNEGFRISHKENTELYLPEEYLLE
ncbi:transposase [Pleomorphovibrio marinus]|uniref:transposase n=1 Tax=Pleomorphovibrio marinus TaxID=2164132 RepID=UPI000E0C8221|nr:transposase [Pleomorphovibrio marinus]